jgi:tricorn protease
VPIGLLGADIDVDEATGLHRFAKIFRPERWEGDIEAPLTMTHANVKDGDYLLAINGVPLAPTDSVDERLANLAGVQVQLTVCSKPDKSDARDIQIKTMRNDFELRYADLCRRNREYVLEKSSGRIGYFHIPDMSGGGLVSFVEGFYPQFRKEALVVDVRNNHGGFVSQMLLERLGRKALAFGKARRGLVDTYPEVVHLGPKACLIDQNAGSDGDIFPYNFRNLGLGKLIGKRSWGGVVGIRSDKGFVDAGMSTQPEFAFWDTRGGWTIEGHGVDPDIEVEMTPEDEIAGRDPQLDRAIEELLKELNQNPGKLPTPPELPVRAGPTAKQPGNNNGDTSGNGVRVGAPVDAPRGR